MHIVLRLVFGTIAVLVAEYLLPGVSVNGVVTALVVAVVIALLNILLKPILVLLSLPVTILTLGLFLVVINGIIIYTTDLLIDGFEVASFWWALAFGLVIGLVNTVLNALAGTGSTTKRRNKDNRSS